MQKHLLKTPNGTRPSVEICHRGGERAQPKSSALPFFFFFTERRRWRGRGAVHTSENMPSPNHSTLRMPAGEDVVFQGITSPGQRGNPCTVPHTSSPVRKPLPSCRGECERQGAFLQRRRGSRPSVSPDSCVSAALLASVRRLLVILPPAHEEEAWVCGDLDILDARAALPSRPETLRPFRCPLVARSASSSCCRPPERLFGPLASAANCPPSQNGPYRLPETPQKQHRRLRRARPRFLR